LSLKTYMDQSLLSLLDYCLLFSFSSSNKLLNVYERCEHNKMYTFEQVNDLNHRKRGNDSL
jgi:hypothetical protein